MMVDDDDEQNNKRDENEIRTKSSVLLAGTSDAYSNTPTGPTSGSIRKSMPPRRF